MAQDALNEPARGEAAPAEPPCPSFPAFLETSRGAAPAGDSRARGTSRLARAARAFARELAGAGEGQPVPADAEGTYALARGTYELAVFDALPGQATGRRFGCLTRGLPLPRDGAAYAVEVFDDGRGTDVARVRVMGYVDRFARAFEASLPLSMPPARPASLRFVARDAAHGDVELRVEGRGDLRVATFARDRSGSVTLGDSRVNLGSNARPLSVACAASLAFVAFCALPAEQHVSLSMLCVDDVLERLGSSDLLEDVRAIVGAVDKAREHPLLNPPGILLYLAHLLRATGIASATLRGMAASGPLAGAQDLTWQAGQDGGDGPAVFVIAPGQGEELPQVRLVRTADYANTFYVAFRREQVTQGAAHMLVETESVLNRFLLMTRALKRRGLLDTATQAQCALLDRWVVESVTTQAAQRASELDAAQPAPGEQVETDLEVRIAFAQACESLVLPYRMEYRFRLDATADHLYVDATTPDMSVMPRDACDEPGGDWRALGPDELGAQEARYAAHLAILLGIIGFGASRRVRAVSVNLWRDGRDDDPASAMKAFGQTCALSVSFARERFVSMLATAPSEEARQAARDARAPWYVACPFAFVRAFTHAYATGAHGELTGTRPLATLDSVVQAHDAQRRRAPALSLLDLLGSGSEGDAAGAGRDEGAEGGGGVATSMLLTLGSTSGIETDESSFDEAGSRLLAAHSVRDMGIYEDTARKQLAGEASDALRSGGATGALNVLRDIHDRTENAFVRGACLSASDGIVRDAITAETPQKMSSVFSDVYGLQADMRAASSAKDPAEAIAALEGIVRKVDDAGWFRDSSTRVYRYFDCYASRAMYGGRCADDLAGRELRLVADEYYLAHHRLAAALSSSVERAEDAIAHARRCVELGPSVATSYLRLARCYFSAFDYRSEIETLKRAFSIMWNPNDVGMALYWLGYAFWMCDMPEAGTACYQRCASYDQNLAQPASMELASFLGKDGVSLMDDEHVDAALRAAGVDVGAAERNATFLVEAADASWRAGSQPLALNLLGSALTMLRDDALTPVLESIGS